MCAWLESNPRIGPLPGVRATPFELTSLASKKIGRRSRVATSAAVVKSAPMVSKMTKTAAASFFD